LLAGNTSIRGQEAGGPSAEPAPPTTSTIVAGPAAPPAAAPQDGTSINVFALAVAGGIFMIPIAGMSLLAATMAIERLIGLRRGRVLPRGLARGVEQLIASPTKFDPRKVSRLCEQFPSAAANVIGVMLQRTGRPVAEIESGAAQACQREADKLYSNVRWLNIAASLSTMLGLIGTIQGMIMAFHRLTIMDPSINRTTALADGIYTALVTTFAGLAVAIPALLASHFFENRILSLIRQIDELTIDLLPHLEREGATAAAAGATAGLPSSAGGTGGRASRGTEHQPLPQA
jgi:biopolymer transport protein ExbB